MHFPAQVLDLSQYSIAANTAGGKHALQSLLFHSCRRNFLTRTCKVPLSQGSMFELNKQRRFKSFSLEEFRRINDQSRFVFAAKERSGDEFDQKCSSTRQTVLQKSHSTTSLSLLQSSKRPLPFLSPKPMREGQNVEQRRTLAHTSNKGRC
jgi:hypothetical protein